ncbi:hypothetical protein HK105_202560 [Polyrhizophydium stewartii]|uniref:MPN domain-containing protein n=1 Tax=Polyrhizophydium stewartii TaxID=2732419 RepID=A0ABR4NDT2_9FUNG|nr:hypothetical protein HK105_000876 [Polyrhizophydium stewartii]
MLTQVLLSTEVHMLCSAYALCTETEEVALLLLGDFEETLSSPAAAATSPVGAGGSASSASMPGSSVTTRAASPTPAGVRAVVRTCFFVVRKDRRRDRVEISSEELSRALSEADSLGLKVVGWCHSHPKITIHPSHVDLGTQLTLQSLDKHFFGIIYSCFHENQNKSMRMQVTAFQSRRAPEANQAIQ